MPSPPVTVLCSSLTLVTSSGASDVLFSGAEPGGLSDSCCGKSHKERGNRRRGKRPGQQEKGHVDLKPSARNRAFGVLHGIDLTQIKLPRAIPNSRHRMKWPGLSSESRCRRRSSIRVASPQRSDTYLGLLSSGYEVRSGRNVPKRSVK